MEITEIKQRLTLARVLQHYGLRPDKNQRLCCPFHDDRTPSMQVYYKTHTAYCFSSNCKAHGKSMDVIDFIMHKENSTKAEAIQKAIALSGGTTTGGEAAGPSIKPSMPKEQFSRPRWCSHKQQERPAHVGVPNIAARLCLHHPRPCCVFSPTGCKHKPKTPPRLVFP